MIVHDSFSRLAAARRSVFFIQIGANDGDQNDPIRHFVAKARWAGILVEPVPEYFEALKDNYRGSSGLHFENVAISDSAANRDFWYLEDADCRLPEWARGLGSFFKDEVTSAAAPDTDLSAHLRSIKVPCMSLEGLLEKYERPAADLLIIDAQGFDGKIIKQVDFSLMKPCVIVYEHILLGKEEKQACREMLEAQGYQLKQDQWDVVAELSE